MYPVPIGSGLGEIRGLTFFERGGQIGAYIGERADRRRVREAEHYFRCKICGGLIDARDAQAPRGDRACRTSHDDVRPLAKPMTEEASCGVYEFCSG
jgi:hypothetical protein